MAVARPASYVEEVQPTSSVNLSPEHAAPELPERDADVVIVGAGIAGLTAAGRLRERSAGALRVLLVDKSRGVGGRLATRRGDGVRFDHGAPNFAARLAPMVGLVGSAAEQGFMARLDDGPERWRGIPTMNAFAKHLAEGLEIVTGAPVEHLGAEGSRWRIATRSGSFTAATVILTCPVPQGLDLLASSGFVLASKDRDLLERIVYEPCIAAMVELEAGGGLAFADWCPDPTVAPDTVLAGATDQQRLGVSEGPAVVLRGTSEFSIANWSASDAVVSGALVDRARAAATLTGEVRSIQIQRWRSARCAVPTPAPFHSLPASAQLLFAGDGFGSGDVEGAVASGFAAADAIVASSRLPGISSGSDAPS